MSARRWSSLSRFKHTTKRKWTIKEVASLAGVTRPAIQAGINRRKIKARKENGVYIIRRPEVAAYLERRNGG